MDVLELDLDVVRQDSLRPYGFQSRRNEIWSKLLHVKQVEDLSETSDEHPDEHQIGLDTSRSFVYYPVEELDSIDEKLVRQAKLHTLIVDIFRHHPRLSYFQGYHDIVSVIFLTLPVELQYSAVEYVSLYRLRDAMGANLEPTIALLRVLKYLLRLADRDYAKLLESVSALPYHALSNILTLFAHDAPTLPIAQHIFDYLLCRPPISVVYLTAAIILARKDEVLLLEREDEVGMIHSLLASLPQFTEDELEEPETPESSTLVPLDEEEEDLPIKSLSLEDTTNPLVIKEDVFEDKDENSKSQTDEKPDIDTERIVETDERVGLREKLAAKSVCLSEILRSADDLRERFPPDHPDLQLSALLGPNSVIFERDVSHAEAEDIAKSGNDVTGTTWIESEFEEDEDEQLQDIREKDRRRRSFWPQAARFTTRALFASALIILFVSIYAARGQHHRDWKIVTNARDGLGIWR